MAIRAVLFDVGGPLDTEVIYERMIDAHIRAAVAAAGYADTDALYAAANDWAVASFAPNAYEAIIWRLTGGDVPASERVYRAVAARASERHAARNGFELRPGSVELLRSLRDRGLRLGLAANQPATAVAALDRHGIGQFFQHREVSGIHGLRKPDVRLFLRACADLDVEPVECVMVGDRIDNDIVPAKTLGMTTIQFVTGRHAHQQPRSWTEQPAFVTANLVEIDRTIADLVDKSA